MADNDQNEAQEAIDVAADGGGASQTKMVIILVVLSILVMVLTPVITFLLVKTTTSKPLKTVKQNQIKTEITIPTIQVNVGDPKASRYARIDIVVEVSDRNMQKFFQPYDPTGNPDGMLLRIKSEILNIIGDKTLDGLLGTKARNELAEEIKDRLNNMLRDKTDGRITDVYFPSFLIQ